MSLLGKKLFPLHSSSLRGNPAVNKSIESHSRHIPFLANKMPLSFHGDKWARCNGERQKPLAFFFLSFRGRKLPSPSVSLICDLYAATRELSCNVFRILFLLFCFVHDCCVMMRRDWNSFLRALSPTKIKGSLAVVGCGGSVLHQKAVEPPPQGLHCVRQKNFPLKTACKKKVIVK